MNKSIMTVLDTFNFIIFYSNKSKSLLPIHLFDKEGKIKENMDVDTVIIKSTEDECSENQSAVYLQSDPKYKNNPNIRRLDSNRLNLA